MEPFGVVEADGMTAILTEDGWQIRDDSALAHLLNAVAPLSFRGWSPAPVRSTLRAGAAFLKGRIVSEMILDYAATDPRRNDPGPDPSERDEFGAAAD